MKTFGGPRQADPGARGRRSTGPRRLVIFARPVGLFSLFAQVVGQLAYCQRAGAIPLVYFNRGSLYWDEAGYRDARNVWEYYFHPVSDQRITDWVEGDLAELESCLVSDFDRFESEGCLVAPPEARRVPPFRTAPDVLVSNRYPWEIVPWPFEAPQPRRRMLAEIVRQHIVVREEIREQVDRFVETRFAGRPVVGVHIRGPEHAVERRAFAPRGLLPFDCHFREIDAFLRGRPAALVYCATDSRAALDTLRSRYGDRLLAWNAIRLDPQDEVRGLHRFEATLPIRARLGEEVLIECLLLARCHHLVHGPSNVSLGASLFNPDLPRTDVYRKYGRPLPVARLLHAWGPRIAGLGRLPAPVRRVLRGLDVAVSFLGGRAGSLDRRWGRSATPRDDPPAL